MDFVGVDTIQEAADRLIIQGTIRTEPAMRAGILVLGVLVGFVSSDPVRAGASIEKQMGPQVFAEKSVDSSGGSDSLISFAVDSAVLTARKYQFHYDASGSGDGRVVVNALWKGDPVF